MASTDPATDFVPTEPVANEDANVAGEKPVKASKEKKVKSPMEKKLTADKGLKPPPAQPPYLQRIFEAIAALKERSGSSPYAIVKFMHEKYKSEVCFGS